MAYERRHSRPQRPHTYLVSTKNRDLLLGPLVGSNAGSPRFMDFLSSLTNLTGWGYETNTLHKLRKSGQARALNPCCRPEGSWALGPRMEPRVEKHTSSAGVRRGAALVTARGFAYHTHTHVLFCVLPSVFPCGFLSKRETHSLTKSTFDFYSAVCGILVHCRVTHQH